MRFQYHNIIPNQFPIERQILSNWCWAACTVSLARFYEGRSRFSQGELVADILNSPACASPLPFPACNQTRDFGDALNRVGHLAAPEVPQPLAPDVLLHILGQGRPVGCQIYFEDAGGHAVIVIGAIADPQRGLLVRVADPGDASILLMSYARFRDSYRGRPGKWVRSYFTKPLNRA